MDRVVDQLETILPILLGWLLGLLTPGIAERIRRPYRRRDLMHAVVDEMIGLQQIMAVVVYKMRSRHADVSDALLDRLLPIAEGDHSPERSEEAIEAMKEMRKLPEQQRNLLHQAGRKPNVGVTLRKYEIPLFATQMADLSICGLDFQRSLLRIRHQLDLLNQIEAQTKSLSDRTFDNLSTQNRESVIANLERCYRDTGNHAEVIMQAISELRAKYGS